MGWSPSHEDDRGEAVAVGDGPVPAAVGRPGRSGQQRLNDRPQLVRHKIVNEGRHGRSLPCPAEGAKRRLSRAVTVQGEAVQRLMNWRAWHARAQAVGSASNRVTLWRSRSARVAGEVVVDRSPADPKGRGDCGHRVLPRAVHLPGHLGLGGGHHRRPTTAAAPDPRRRQPGGRAFTDQVAFELGQGHEDVEDQLAARGGGVDRLLQTPEADPTLGQAG